MPLISKNLDVPARLVSVRTGTCLVSVKLTRVTLPVKIVLGVTVTLQLCPKSLTGRTVREWNVIVGNVVEEVNLLLLQHEASSNRVHRSIAPPLIKEPAVLVQRLKKVNVRLRSQPVEATNLEIGPLWYEISNRRLQRLV